MRFQFWLIITFLVTLAVDLIVMKKVPKSQMLDSFGVTWRILLIISLPLATWAYGVYSTSMILFVINSLPVVLSLFFLLINMAAMGIVVIYRFSMGER